MNFETHNPTNEHGPADVPARTERLISRCLDNEITAEERAALDRLLAGNPAARAMFEAYRRNDLLAAHALNDAFQPATTVAAPGRFRGYWLATVGAVSAAAAVIAVSFLLSYAWPSSPGVDGPNGDGQPRVVERAMPGRSLPAPAPRTGGDRAVSPRFVEYRNDDYRPYQRVQDVHQDVIGIRGQDEDVILILELDRTNHRVIPVSGEF